MRMTLAEIAACLQAVGDWEKTPQTASVVPTGVVTDSRLAREGELYFCIEGEHFDGHTFAAEVARTGLAAIVAQQDVSKQAGDTPVLIVPDTVQALGRLAGCHRLRSGATVVAITGSAGKTTVKEMLAATLSRTFTVAKNNKNFNNQIGLPLSMLAASGDEDVWVMEAGISRPGDMTELAAIVMPDITVIHNVGPAHLEELGSLENVAREKAELCTTIRPGGRAVINIDFEDLHSYARKGCDEIVSISTGGSPARFVCRYVGEKDGEGLYMLTVDGEPAELTLPFTGMHMAQNVAAVAAVAKVLGMKPDEIRAGFADMPRMEGRFDIREVGPFTLIDDTYNANPLSMESAIERASTVQPGAPHVAVLGEMRELGDEATRAHRQLGARLADSPFTHVFFKGGYADDVRAGLEEAGYTGTFATFDTDDRMAAAFADLSLDEGAVVLFKASRSLTLEKTLGALARSLRQTSPSGGPR